MAQDEYGRGKTAKGDPKNFFPFNIKKTQPPPPPATLTTTGSPLGAVVYDE